ncbi:calcium/calmodulin-dependent protein kinase type 1 [Aspergillus lentulus]|nr:calcium/calmodulin-dependent protein kinase type 1 [Aspergillus lentulus]
MKKKGGLRYAGGPVPDPFQYAPYFVRSSAWYEGELCIFIALEYMALGDLQGYLGKAIPETEARTITVQLLEGLRLMHDEGFAHRDLKPANIFVTSKGPSWKVKIGDFGVSKQVDQDKEAAVDGSGFAYTPAVDIWSLGVITFYMLTGRLPFEGLRGLFKYMDKPDDSPFRAKVSKLAENEAMQEVDEEVVPDYRRGLSNYLLLQFQANFAIFMASLIAPAQ